MTDILDINFTQTLFSSNLPAGKGELMNPVIAFALAQSLMLVATANADMICEGKTRFEQTLRLTVKIGESARLEIFNEDGSSEWVQEFTKLDNVWDGHKTGLMTAPGLSFKYAGREHWIHRFDQHSRMQKSERLGMNLAGLESAGNGGIEVAFLFGGAATTVRRVPLLPCVASPQSLSYASCVTYRTKRSLGSRPPRPLLCISSTK